MGKHDASQIVRCQAWTREWPVGTRVTCERMKNIATYRGAHEDGPHRADAFVDGVRYRVEWEWSEAKVTEVPNDQAPS